MGALRHAGLLQKRRAPAASKADDARLGNMRGKSLHRSGSLSFQRRMPRRSYSIPSFSHPARLLRLYMGSSQSKTSAGQGHIDQVELSPGLSDKAGGEPSRIIDHSSPFKYMRPGSRSAGGFGPIPSRFPPACGAIRLVKALQNMRLRFPRDARPVYCKAEGLAACNLQTTNPCGCLIRFPV